MNNPQEYLQMQYDWAMFIYHVWLPVCISLIVLFVLIALYHRWEESRPSEDEVEKDPDYITSLNL
jgi:Na+/H+ antiporter NhaD/arsenite permease-like protein